MAWESRSFLTTQYDECGAGVWTTVPVRAISSGVVPDLGEGVEGVGPGRCSRGKTSGTGLARQNPDFFAKGVVSGRFSNTVPDCRTVWPLSRRTIGRIRTRIQGYACCTKCSSYFTAVAFRPESCTNAAIFFNATRFPYKQYKMQQFPRFDLISVQTVAHSACNVRFGAMHRTKGMGKRRECDLSR